MADRSQLKALYNQRDQRRTVPAASATTATATTATATTTTGVFGVDDAATSNYPYAMNHLQDIAMERTATRRPDDAVRMIARMRHTGEWLDVNIDSLHNWMVTLLRNNGRATALTHTWPKSVKKSMGHIDAERVARFVNLVLDDVRRSYNGDNYDVRRLVGRGLDDHRRHIGYGGELEFAVSEFERWTAMRERMKRRGLLMNSVKHGVTGSMLAAGGGMIGLTALGLYGYHKYTQARQAGRT